MYRNKICHSNTMYRNKELNYTKICYNIRNNSTPNPYSPHRSLSHCVPWGCKRPPGSFAVIMAPMHLLKATATSDPPNEHSHSWGEDRCSAIPLHGGVPNVIDPFMPTIHPVSSGSQQWGWVVASVS
jgi:hypothetical protein